MVAECCSGRQDVENLMESALLQCGGATMTNNRLSAFRRWDVVGWILRWYNLPSEIRRLLTDLQLIPDYSQEILSGLELGLRRPGNPTSEIPEIRNLSFS